MLKGVKCKPMYCPLEPNITCVSKCKLRYFTPKHLASSVRKGLGFDTFFPPHSPNDCRVPAEQEIGYRDCHQHIEFKLSSSAAGSTT